jgi:hypothetical protein
MDRPYKDTIVLPEMDEDDLDATVLKSKRGNHNYVEILRQNIFNPSFEDSVTTEIDLKPLPHKVLVADSGPPKIKEK